MPFLDRLTDNALEKLCRDCPITKDAERMFAVSEPFSYIIEGEVTSVDADHPLVKLGHQVVTASFLTATLILKEELGCDGPYNCGHCDFAHCGAQRFISPNFQFRADLDNLGEH